MLPNATSRRCPCECSARRRQRRCGPPLRHVSPSVACWRGAPFFSVCKTSKQKQSTDEVFAYLDVAIAATGRLRTRTSATLPKPPHTSQTTVLVIPSLHFTVDCFASGTRVATFAPSNLAMLSTSNLTSWRGNKQCTIAKPRCPIRVESPIVLIRAKRRIRPRCMMLLQTGAVISPFCDKRKGLIDLGV